MAANEIDWRGFGKTRFATTIEKLNRYSACDVDPFVCQIAQLACEQFKFPPHGIQNLARVIGSLPAQEFHNDELGFGYTTCNIVRLISSSDSGFNFLGICGALSEYYDEDFIVEFFVLLAQRLKVPFQMSPSELQWRNLIKVCAGVLATSEFGLLLGRYEDLVKTGHSNDPATILDMLLIMTAKKGKVVLKTGRDTPWFASIAEMLFDLKFVIKHGDHLTLGQDADLVLEYDDTTDTPRNTGGRIVWDAVFKSCFGSAFKDIDKDSLALIIAGVSAFIHKSITDSKHDSRSYFIPQVSEIPALAGTGLNETMMAWFPEIRRLASRIEKVNMVDFEDFRKNFEATIAKLESACTCNLCGKGSETSDFCLASLTQTIVFIGFYVARMVVIPKLYLKRSGVLKFYQRLHEGRLKRKKEQPEPRPRVEEAEFVRQISAALPSPFQMLEAAQLLFTGSTSDLHPETLCVMHSGTVIGLTNLKSIADDNDPNLKSSLVVSSGVPHFHNRVFRQALWDNGVSGVSYAEQFEISRTQAKEISQAAKFRGHDVLFTFIWLNKGQEEKAEAAGWDLIDKYDKLSLEES